MASERKVHFKIKRQESATAQPRWEEFMLPWEPMMNVISAFMQIQRNPVNAAGQKTTPISYSSNCLEEVCGACTMVINGKVRQSCSALIDKLKEPITIEPMTKYPVVRDLYVDRERIFDDFKRAKAWIFLDGTYDLGPGPRYSKDEAEARYALSRCMACGCCMEACPNYGPHSDYIGAAVVNQVRLFNMHPSGKMQEHERLEALKGQGGIGDCGMAQNCEAVCPKDIPLVTSLGEMMRATTRDSFWSLFRRDGKA
jgi:succinate dehydrogenase / fumarate reductase, iron-sulfur subunit